MRYRCIDRVRRQYSVNSNALRKCSSRSSLCARRVHLVLGQEMRFSSSTTSTAEDSKMPKASVSNNFRTTAKFRDLISFAWNVLEEKSVALVNPAGRVTMDADNSKINFEVSHKTEPDTIANTSSLHDGSLNSDQDALKQSGHVDQRERDPTFLELAQKVSLFFSTMLSLKQTLSKEAPVHSLSPDTSLKPSSLPTNEPASKPAVDRKPQIMAHSASLKKSLTARENVDNRTRYLLRAVASATSLASRSTRVQEFCRHLYNNAQAKSLAVKEGGIAIMLRLKLVTKDLSVQSYINEALALMGYHPPLLGRGIRILSIDGGGIRGIMAIEILRALEQVTKKPAHQLFDYMCGVSTGAILTMLLGALKMSMDECEEMYKRTSTEVFTQNSWWGTGQLVLNHAYYDTNAWSKQLKQILGEIPLIHTARDRECPKIGAISTVVNHSRLLPFVFRNYDYPIRHQSTYPGMYTPQLWEAVRASAAAPGYFEEFTLDDYVHQDGGVLSNNPSALAIHECRHLWPNEAIQCVVSIGNGRYEPQVERGPTTSSSLKTKLLKIIDSATDTEAVHTMLGDLLPPSRYYRFNPYLSGAVSLDEIRPEKFKQLHDDARMYLRKNESKLHRAAEMLLEPRGTVQKLRDSVKRKMATYL